MTNQDKKELKELAKQGLSFKEIKRLVICCDSTIKEYIKQFSPQKKGKNDAN